VFQIELRLSPGREPMRSLPEEADNRCSGIGDPTRQLRIEALPAAHALCRGREDTMLVRSIFLIIGLVACLAVFGVSQPKEVRHVAVKPTSPASGSEMYTAYCAVCRGFDGKGNGRTAEALKVPPPDLTALAKKNGGKYPFDHVTSAIQADLRLPAHGSKEMPVWGSLFWGMSQGHSSEVQLHVTNLNKYIESLQAKHY